MCGLKEVITLFTNHQTVFHDIDNGPTPCVMNIKKSTLQNHNYRAALWTGSHLQLTVMSIPAGGEVGLEIHEDTDQFFYVEGGVGKALMGADKSSLGFKKLVERGDAIFIPAGTWHNIVNLGKRPLKLYSIYAPPHHPHGTVHKTKLEADEQEHHF